MFEEFKEKKFSEFLSLVQFTDGKINLIKLGNSKLPPFIVNFFECSYDVNSISRAEFEKTLRKAIIFNINYIVKPKATILKFIFGTVETKPAKHVKQKLEFFQFYSYYISHIENFIEINDPHTISKNQIERLINEINEKILQEINGPLERYTQRLNLIKLLYYFFLELTDNNPINIKLPKKILSIFFNDKGYKEIKRNIDGFFSDEIFIQEALELLNPANKQEKKSESHTTGEELDDKTLKELIEKAKTSLLSSDSYDKEIQHALNLAAIEKEIKDEELTSVQPAIQTQTETTGVITDITELHSEPMEEVELLDKKVDLDEKIYSEDLKFQSQLDEAIRPEPLSNEETKLKKLNELFCEETPRKRIIKKIFNKDEKKFISTVSTILDSPTWEEATIHIEELFNENKIKYFSEEAVKFVDLIESYYTGNTEPMNKVRGNERP